MLLHGRSIRSLLLLLVLLYGASLRISDLAVDPLWTDEAETSINALTILEHGVPVDHYVGVPIFENTLTSPWPESPEYEFRDSSYSRRGLSIYHGWLPLYAVAASFALYGVEPDEPQQSLTVRHGVEEFNLRTTAARTPAVIFGTLFLLVIFLAARALYGEDAGWAALASATVSSTIIGYARQARYYSLTLLLGALCALMLYRLMAKAHRRDFVAGGFLLVLLFHTNLLAFAGMCGAFALAALLGRDRSLGKLLITGMIVAVGTIPWMILTGFLTAASDRPMAYSLLEVDHIIRYAWQRAPFVAVGSAAVAWLLFLPLARRHLPEQVVKPFAGYRARFLLLMGWVLVGFTAFIVLVPAASYFTNRLTLVLVVPSLLFGSMLFAALGRTLAPRYSSVVASALAVLFLAATGRVTLWPRVESQPFLFDVIEQLRAMDLRTGTKLYADTSMNLPLRFYTGLPFQNVMPVRRTFLNEYAHDLVIVEGPSQELLSWTDAQRTAVDFDYDLSEEEARATARLANRLIAYEGLADRVRSVSGERPQVSDPVFFAALSAQARRKTRSQLEVVVAESGNPMFDGFAVADYRELWQVFFYRFVDPSSRMGDRLNYASRIKSCEALALPGGWAVIECPARVVQTDPLAPEG